MGTTGAGVSKGSSKTRGRGFARAWLALCGATLILLAAAPSAGAVTWNLQSAPAPQGSNGQLFAVSCATSSSCMGVGFFIDSMGQQKPLSETWNGSSWTMRAVPMPPNVPYGSLRGVSCTAANACVAVGGTGLGAFTNSPLAEVWNGSSWTIKSVPIPSGGSTILLNSVSCTSSSACTAVGSVATASGSVPVAERWNGSSWSLQSIPNPGAAKQTALNGVSCSGSVCTAVGDYSASSGVPYPNKTLAERWNGSSWSIQTTPSQSSAQMTELDGVSCSSATACTAVGGFATNNSSPNRTLAERWNGSSWTIQSTADPGTAPSLSGVSCPSATDCTAVGTGLGGPALVVEQWNGSSWKSQSAPNPSGAETVTLSGVSCTGAGACTGAGGAADGLQIPQSTLAERWNGSSWKVQTSANASGALLSTLNAVSCSTGSACAAVGHFTSSAGTGRTLAEAWNGSSWTIQSTSDPSSLDQSLNGISCPTSTACTAVGSFENGSFVTVPLAERWNGTSWSLQSVPVPSGGSEVTLKAVSCPSSSSCMAVGSFFNSNTQHLQRLAERWNGTSWTISSTQAASGETYSTLNGVSCTSSSACKAVGGYSTTTNAFKANKLLAEHWNGSSWQIRATPSPAGTTFATFTGVSCSAQSACTAAGGYATTGGAASANAPLAERWDGQTWAIQTTLNPSSQGFNGDSCSTSSACTAVGGFGTIFAEGWNGSTWTTQTVASPPTGGGQLLGVSCTAATACTAVGQVLSNYLQKPIFANTVFVGQMDVPFAQRDPAGGSSPGPARDLSTASRSAVELISAGHGRRLAVLRPR